MAKQPTKDQAESRPEEASLPTAGDEATESESPAEESAPVAATDEADSPSAAAQLTLGTAPADEAETEQAVPVIRGKVDPRGRALGTGRRKTAVARVRVQQGTGRMTINDRSLDDYFRVERDRLTVEAPLKAVGQHGKVDVWVRVEGGGTTGQTGAIVLGIARALQALDPAIHHTLSEGGYLTRDGRMVERKKYGYKKARKSFQFSKR